MNSRLSRRAFLQRSILTAGAFSFTPLLGPNILRAQGAVKKLNCVQIGCGGRAMAHLEWIVEQAGDNVAAIVDPDEKQHAKVKAYLQRHDRDPAKVQVFTDYRTMFDKIGKEIDAVFIAAPNHHHALAAMIAMQLGKNVYCEKPVCHNIAEAREMREMAARSKVVTQMGNQGHCEEGYRRL